MLKCYVLLVVSVEISNMGDGVFLDTMLTIGTTDTRLLDASVEALHGLEVLAVDVSLAEFQFTSYAGSCVDVLGEYRRSQTVFAIVSPSNGLVDAVELYQWNDWAESLLVDDVHILCAVVKYGSCIEVTLVTNTVSATKKTV